LEKLIPDGYKKATSAETLARKPMHPIIMEITTLFQASYYTPCGNNY